MLTFAAPSGTGKTTLLVGVIAALVARGLRPAIIKHDAHRLRLDTPGKDSWRFRQAGAWRVVVAGRELMGMFGAVEGALSLTGLADPLLMDADVILTEGFRQAGLPTILVRRAGAADPTWAVPDNVVAIAADAPVAEDVPWLPLDDPAAVADFICAHYLAPAASPRRVTAVLPVGPELDERTLAAWVERVGELFAQVLLVAAPGAPVLRGVACVADIRPGLGPLGALLTGLAAAETPDVMLWGVRHQHAPAALVRGIVQADVRADVVVMDHDTWREPLLALYGHRCLSAIQGALLSGERRMDGWWGAVRVRHLPELLWRPWDEAGAAFSDIHRYTSSTSQG